VASEAWAETMDIDIFLSALQPLYIPISDISEFAVYSKGFGPGQRLHQLLTTELRSTTDEAGCPCV